ncbi:MAG: hypothetical protein ACOY3V_08135 [Pseudomonadota bacterium]
MIALVAAFSFCLGLLMGYQLPVFLAWWRAYRRRRAYKLSVLRPYVPGQETPPADPDDSAS